MKLECPKCLEKNFHIEPNISVKEVDLDGTKRLTAIIACPCGYRAADISILKAIKKFYGQT